MILSFIFTAMLIIAVFVPTVFSLVFTVEKTSKYQGSQNRTAKIELAIESVAGLFFVGAGIAFMVSFFATSVGSPLEMTGLIVGVILSIVGSVFIGTVFIGETFGVFGTVE